MLSWLPIVGPVIDGIVSIFTSFKNTELGKYQTDGTVYQAQLQANNAITLAFVRDIPVRLARDIIMFPGSAWCGIYIWDKIIGHHYPHLVFGVLPLTGSMSYLPYALLGFFFGAAALNWNKQ
jgi:hypothetical protein